MTPQQVVDEIKESGLRGRGGGGFPTGLKWQFAKIAVGDKKYVACNADEGDPGAFMDRSVLEGDPHAVIESNGNRSLCIGADEGYVLCPCGIPDRCQTPSDSHRSGDGIRPFGRSHFRYGFQLPF